MAGRVSPDDQTSTPTFLVMNAQTVSLSQEATTMNNREDRNRKALKQPVPPYARLFFDHLYSEYIALKPSIKDGEIANLLESINQKRQQQQLTWSDIYTFDLALVDARPADGLIRKAFDARAKYRSVAGQKEYDEYIASRSLDLGTIQVDPEATPPQPNVVIERELRAEIRYLLSKFYLYYALLPMHEGLRDDLTRKAVIMTSAVVVVIALANGASFIPSLEKYSAVVVTLLTVALAGIVGGCVSMLQRIQSASSEGDALYNLAALTNGWRGILLSPLYGGIFACLLFVLFAAGILSGSVFPTIVTPGRNSQAQASATPAAGSAPRAASPAASPTPLVTPSQTPTTASANSGTPARAPAPQETPKPEAPTPAPTPAVATTRTGVLQIKDFLKETGPASGISYSLLIIWSFLAGFAERLVPDTLNRLVQKNIDIQGGKS
jgi:hypothetical protein